jgi:hypothetical protein
MALSLVRLLFAIAGVYDLAIGVAFVGFGPQIYDAAGVPPPNHWAYIRFAALLLVIFGIMFLAVAYAPVANRNLIPYGVLLKLSYVVVVVYYWVRSGDVPMLFKPFAAIDAVMLVLFLLAYAKTSTTRLS